VKITCNYRRHPARVGICESAAELAADRVILRAAGERASRTRPIARYRLNIAACHDRRLFVASGKSINDTPARCSLSLSPSLLLPLSLSLSLFLFFSIRCLSRAREYGIYCDELFAPPIWTAYFGLAGIRVLPLRVRKRTRSFRHEFADRTRPIAMCGILVKQDIAGCRIKRRDN